MSSIIQLVIETIPDFIGYASKPQNMQNIQLTYTYLANTKRRAVVSCTLHSRQFYLMFSNTNTINVERSRYFLISGIIILCTF